MLIEIFSVGAIDALVPVLIIVIFIGAAAGISRGFSFFNLFGVGTLMGMGPKAKGSLAQKTFKKSYTKPSQKPLKVKKTKFEDEKENKDKQIRNDFNRYFNKGTTAATIDTSGPEPKGASQLNEPDKKSSSIFVNAFEKSLILTSPLVRGTYGAGKGFVNLVAKKGRLKKLAGVVYKYDEETFKIKKNGEEKNFARYTNRGYNTLLEENMFGLAVARREVLKEKQKIINDKKLSQIKKKLLLANLAGLDRVFSKRLENLENSFDKINKLQDSYTKKLLSLRTIQDEKIKEEKRQKIIDETYNEFAKIYTKSFNTTSDYRAEDLINNIQQITNKRYGKFTFNLRVGGKDPNEKSKDYRTLIEFNLGRKEEK